MEEADYDEIRPVQEYGGSPIIQPSKKAREFLNHINRHGARNSSALADKIDHLAPLDSSR